jgi:pimeloyl-ACP methyl ester carboxylesterase
MKSEKTLDGIQVALNRIETNGTTLNVATAGAGRSVLLLHGWPFNWYVWHRILPGLVRHGFRVIAPDLRGIGESSRPSGGYDLHSLAKDLEGLLQALEADEADVVGFDLGLQQAVMLALRHPERVRHLVLTEALVGRLPGAEKFLKAGPPWWFGFHAAPGLAERVLVGHEETYLNWFYENSTVQKLSEESRAEYIRAYTGSEALRGGFDHYRAFAVDAQQIEDAFAGARLRQPTLVIGGGAVRDATFLQLHPFADEIRYTQIENCGHVTPQEQPAAFLEQLLIFFSNG